MSPTLPGPWAALSSAAIAALPADTVAVLPLGATEQHGPHLPTGTDTLLVEAVLSRALDRLPAGHPLVVLPSMAVTKSGEHAAWPGTLAIGPALMLGLIDAIGAGVARAGLRRLFLLNGHGGNTALLEVAVRELRQDHGLITAHASWFGFADLSSWPAEDLRDDLHGGDLETSAMLALQADLVEMDRAGEFGTSLDVWARETPAIGLGRQAVRPGWLAQDLNAAGAMGRASVASAEKGEALLHGAAEALAEALRQFARFDPSGKGASS